MKLNSAPKIKYCKVCKTEICSKHYRLNCGSLFCDFHYKENKNNYNKIYKFKNRFILREKYKIYRKTATGRKKANENNKRMAKKFRYKWRARAKVHYAIKTGKLIPKPCEICGVIKVQGHHADYSKPYDVQWLCALHHRIIDGKQIYL